MPCSLVGGESWLHLKGFWTHNTTGSQDAHIQRYFNRKVKGIVSGDATYSLSERGWTQRSYLEVECLNFVLITQLSEELELASKHLIRTDFSAIC